MIYEGRVEIKTRTSFKFWQFHLLDNQLFIRGKRILEHEIMNHGERMQINIEKRLPYLLYSDPLLVLCWIRIIVSMLEGQKENGNGRKPSSRAKIYNTERYVGGLVDRIHI